MMLIRLPYLEKRNQRRISDSLYSYLHTLANTAFFKCKHYTLIAETVAVIRFFISWLTQISNAILRSHLLGDAAQSRPACSVLSIPLDR